MLVLVQEFVVCGSDKNQKTKTETKTNKKIKFAVNLSLTKTVPFI